MNNVNIEVKSEVIRKLNIKYKNRVLDLKHVPFNDFSVKCINNKVDTVKNYNTMINEIKNSGLKLNDSMKKLAMERAKSITNTYTVYDGKITVTDGSVITVYVPKNNILKMYDDVFTTISQFKEIRLYDEFDKKDVTETYLPGLNDMLNDPSVINILRSSKKVNENILLDTVRNIVSLNGLFNHLNSKGDTVKVIKERKPVTAPGKNKKGKKRNNVTYINKTRYIIDNYVDDTIEKRDYNLTAESWPVRGHWRTYKSGKKVWIPAYTKNPQTNENAETERVYKITK